MTTSITTSPTTSLPRIKLSTNHQFGEVQKILKGLALNTVCEEATCPNRHQCWSEATATFLLMGRFCSRHCKFCSVLTTKNIPPLDDTEPYKIATAVKEMKLKYVVLTSVTRDDLQDGGAGHFKTTLELIREYSPGTLIEILTPDFLANENSLQLVAESRPNVWAHNVETVRSLSPLIRDRRANYDQSLFVLKRIKELSSKVAPHSFLSKSAILLGIGETMSELEECFHDLKQIDLDIITIGQYLKPSPKSIAVKEMITPQKFKEIEHLAMSFGFKEVIAGPLVRSSYRAHYYFTRPFVRMQLGKIDYKKALETMEKYVELVASGKSKNMLLSCTHPPLVTIGRKGSLEEDVPSFQGEVHFINRGGKATYHGPSQLIIYPILNLNLFQKDLLLYVRTLEQTLIDVLQEHYNLQATPTPSSNDNSFSNSEEKGRYTGVWIQNKKVASIGVAVKKWITFHGIAINLDKDDLAFQGINPCGFSASMMGSIEEFLKEKIDRTLFEDHFLTKLETNLTKLMN